MILLSYRFDPRDNKHKFGVEFQNSSGIPYHDAWTQWVFYGIGKIINKKKIHLYPFTITDYLTNKKFIIKKWEGVTYRSAIKYGESIAKIILKKLEQMK